MINLKKVKLGEITKLISSGATLRGGSKMYITQGPVLFLRSQNIQMGHLDLSDVAFITDKIDNSLRRTRIQTGDVLLNITGASIGRVATFDLIDRKANVNQHVCVIRPIGDKLHSKYLSRYLATPQFQSKIKQLQNGGARRALTFSKIADFDIPLPTLSEQKRIAGILDKADAICRKRQQAIKLAAEFLRATFLDMFGDPVSNPVGWDNGSSNSMKEMVSKGNYEKILLYKPPYEMQKKFGTLFEKNIVLIDKVKILEKMSNDFFSSISQRAFRGEL